MLVPNTLVGSNPICILFRISSCSDREETSTFGKIIVFTNSDHGSLWFGSFLYSAASACKFSTSPNVRGVHAEKILGTRRDCAVPVIFSDASFPGVNGVTPKGS